MDTTDIFGILGEGKGLCLICAGKVYGKSLERYMQAGEIQILSDQDRPNYASCGLLCDECLRWIFPPEKTGESWWLEDPATEESIRLLAPFADFLEKLQVDVRNLRCIAIG